MPDFAKNRPLQVTLVPSASGVAVRIGDNVVDIVGDSAVPINRVRHDFAAWLALPIAMRCGLDLHIHGAGSETTVQNARRLAEIWSRWLPGHFRPVTVRFAETWTPGSVPTGEGDVCFYSGGVDSTYALLKRLHAGQRQALLTMHGGDYRYDDPQRFAEFLDKTAGFAARVGTGRVLVRTNVKNSYIKFAVNPSGSNVSHSFQLCAMAFLFSESFGRPVIAADYRVDQQFEVRPWGTNAGTNRWFSDGVFNLVTECDDVTRAEKCSLFAESPEALAALTFCSDYASRPFNCGHCQKCVRTKAMFVAANGRVPDIFRDPVLAPGCLNAFDMSKNYQRAFFFDLYETAMRHGRAMAIPGLTEKYRKAIAPALRRQRLTDALAGLTSLYRRVSARGLLARVRRRLAA